METLNQQLKNFRLERKLSQRALAARLGCSHSYIGRMENGHLKIRPCILTGYKLIGFKEQPQDNNTTFTDEEFRELREWQDSVNNNINSLTRLKVDKCDVDLVNFNIEKFTCNIEEIKNKLELLSDRIDDLEMALDTPKSKVRVTGNTNYTPDNDNSIFKDLPIKFKNIVTHKYFILNIINIAAVICLIFLIFVGQ